MIAVISPAKTLDYDSPHIVSDYSKPDLLHYSQRLINICQTLVPDEIANLMKISPKLAELNYRRFQNWHSDYDIKSSRQAIFAFKGDVYEGLNVDDFSKADLLFAQNHLRILSGLYGLLKPLDLMLPYRLEMGTKLRNNNNSNLYQFWKDIITDKLNEHLKKNQDDVILNLASNEYFKAINQKKLAAKIIMPIFLDESKRQYKVISFYAKKARGLMSRYLIKNQIDSVNDLQSFNLAGYQFNAKESNESQWIFSRSAKLAEYYKQQSIF